MRSPSKFCTVLIAGAAALLLSSAAKADSLLYNLPETSGTGVNATPNQTNVSYNACENELCGSLFGGDVTNTSSDNWNISTLVVWVVDNEQITGAGASTATPTEPSAFSNLELVGGLVDGSIANVAGSPVITAAPYSGSLNGTNYLSPSGGYDGVWQVSFSVPSIFLAPGQTYAFAVADTSSDANNDTTDLALNATTCTGAAGATPCVSDGIVVITGGAVAGAYNYADSSVSADVNVALYGTATPEPTTWMLFGAGFGVLGLVRRRRG